MKALLLTFALAAPALADWPQFRGPNGSGVSADKNLPEKIDATTQQWAADLPGRSVASPIVFGGHVYVACSSGNREDRLHVLAFDAATGKKLWHRQLAATGSTACHPKSAMAAMTPVADEKGVYTLFATGDLAAFDHDGKLLWYRSLVGDYPTISNQLGLASSPALFDGKLIVPMDNAGESFIAALDTGTGKNVWKTTRPADINWVTPIVRPLTSTDAEVLQQGPKGLTAYDLATGKEKWSHKAAGGSPTPSLADGLLIVPSGGVSVFKPGDGKLEQVWTSPKYRTGYSSPLYYDGRVYAVAAGRVFSADAKTGKDVWAYTLKGKQMMYASPVAGDGKVYVLSDAGAMTVLKAGGDTEEELSVTQLKAECMGTPAISGGAVFIQTDKQLLCFKKG
jgi:outer membrane protein assembly factor BamB